MINGVVYLFNCPMCNVGRYVGSTRRLLRVRVDAHKGVSYRTGAKLSNPEFSNIRNHAKQCKCDINYKDFKVLGKSKNDQQLTILESLFIKTIVPELNSQASSASRDFTQLGQNSLRVTQLSSAELLGKPWVSLSLSLSLPFSFFF